MGAVFDNLAGVHHIEVIGVFDRAQAMGDNNRCAIFAEQFQ